VVRQSDLTGLMSMCWLNKLQGYRVLITLAEILPCYFNTLLRGIIQYKFKPATARVGNWDPNFASEDPDDLKRLGQRHYPAKWHLESNDS
jgi:hypothetical protein